MSDEDRNDELIAAASGLAKEISPERDLWPGIAEGIAAPKRSRWTPMLAQAAAVVLLIGASSGVFTMCRGPSGSPWRSKSALDSYS